MDPTPVYFGWGEIIKLALTAALSAGVVTFLLGLIRDNKGEKTKASYLALRLAVIFERFAIECAEVISDIDLRNDSSGAAGRVSPIPALPDYPID